MNLGRGLCILLLVVFSMGAVVALSGCSAIQTMSDRDGTRRGFLQLIVEPSHTEVFLNSEYQGVVSGWIDGVIPVPAGVQRLELRASGYMTQRFDLEVGANEQVTLELNMERDLEDLSLEDELSDHGNTIP